METQRREVLDHGYVELVDVMGNDQAIVEAARQSIAGANVRPVSEDRGLIRYLMRNRHTTPFEMVELKFRAKMPIFVARQWVRHRTASINEMSARYSELPEEYYVPRQENIKLQATKNKQGRASEEMGNSASHRHAFAVGATASFADYQCRLDEGMARELARINLPLSAYTEWYWKIDLHNLFGFLSLRMHEHSQYEIRVYAEAMAEMVKPIVPLAWEAFEDYRLGGMFLSRCDIEALKVCFLGEEPDTEKHFPTKSSGNSGSRPS
jgi:thymidylate synthase (FAD)